MLCTKLTETFSLFNCTAEQRCAHSRRSVHAAHLVGQMKPQWDWQHSVSCSAVKMLCLWHLGKSSNLATYCLFLFLFPDHIFIVQIDEQDDGKRFKSVFPWDIESKEGATAPNRQPLENEVREGLWMGLDAEKRRTRHEDEMYSSY